MTFLLFLLFTIFGAKLHRKFPKVSYIFRAFSFYEIVTWNSWKYFTHYVHIFSKKNQSNNPFLSCVKVLYQSEAKCTPI